MRSTLLERFRKDDATTEPDAAASGDPAAHDDLGDPNWPSQVHAHSLRLRPLTAVLTIVLVAIAGIWGGAELQKRHGGGGTSASAGGFSAANLAARFGRTGRTGTGGFGGFGGAGGTAAAGGTSGTVTEVTPKILYLTSATGALVKIALTKTTTFTRTSSTPTGGLKIGDTAIVIGAKNAAGVVVATSVIATQKGVTATRGGFGGFGGGGATAGAGG
jgi:hypothetical protein